MSDSMYIPRPEDLDTLLAGGLTIPHGDRLSLGDLLDTLGRLEEAQLCWDVDQKIRVVEGKVMEA